MARNKAPAAASSSSSQSDNSTSSEQQLTQPPNPAPESASESDPSDSDSDSPPLKIKPISSSPSPKQMQESFSTMKQQQNPKKRPAPDKPDEGGSGSGSTKKVLFQRLWSEQDELVILKGIIDYKAKKGRDPMGFPDDFLDFIKKSLHFVDANKSQIVNKVQRLKKKFENANSKTKKRKISNPVELKAFELSKQVWGGGGADRVAVRVHDNGVSSSKVKALDVVKKKKEKGEVANWVVSRCEKEMPMPMSVVGNGGVLKEGMKLLGEKERVEMAEKFRKHNVAEMEVYVKRLELVREVTQKTLNAIKSARN